MKKNSQKFGKESEELARKYLINKGYTILETNWRFKKYELDIIAESDDFIVFIEVKARSSIAYGEPEMFVTAKKQKFMIAAANSFLETNSIEKEARFDIIAILPINNNINVKHLEAAFYPSAK